MFKLKGVVPPMITPFDNFFKRQSRWIIYLWFLWQRSYDVDRRKKKGHRGDDKSS